MTDKNKETIDKAIDIYRDAMRSHMANVIRKVEGKQADNAIIAALPDRAVNQYIRNRKENRTIEGSLDLLYLPRLTSKYWKYLNVSQDKTTVIHSMRDIVNARNAVAHPDTYVGDTEVQNTIKLINDSLDDFRLSNAKSLLRVISESESSNNNEAKYNIDEIRSNINHLNEKYDDLHDEISALKANVDDISEDQLLILDHITKTEKDDVSDKKHMKRNLPAPVMPEVPMLGYGAKSIKRKPPWFNPPRIR